MWEPKLFIVLSFDFNNKIIHKMRTGVGAIVTHYDRSLNPYLSDEQIIIQVNMWVYIYFKEVINYTLQNTNIRKTIWVNKFTVFKDRLYFLWP